ncbi:unnamed protein product [Tilletia controversa]|nr:unnamed protein product [Tilletia controversa]
MTPKDLWDFLKEEYASSSIHARIRIRRALTDALANPKPAMRDHIADISNIYAQLAETGDPVKEEYRCAELLGSLPDAFQNWVAAQSDATKWGILRLNILEEERRLKAIEDRTARNRTETALAVGANLPAGSGSSPGYANNRGGYGYGRGGGYGYGRGGGRGRGRGGFGYGPFPGKCNICRKQGHKALECPHYDAYRKFQETLPAGDEAPERVATIREAGHASQAQNDGNVEDFEFEICSAVGAAPTKSHTFILDTASSRHIVTDRSKLCDYRPAAPGTRIDLKDGKTPYEKLNKKKPPPQFFKPACTLLHDQQAGTVPEFALLDDERDPEPQQPPANRPQNEAPPALQHAMQSALQSGAVPPDVLAPVRAIADGAQVSRDALAAVARRLMAQSRDLQAMPSTMDHTRTGERRAGAEQQARSTEETRAEE